MKKIILFQIQQYNQVFYIGKYDPRKLVRMTDPEIDLNTIQEAQRPLDRKHLKEIAEYTSPIQQGMLPASVLISTKDRDKLQLCTEPDENGNPRYYINFPETEDELASYRNTIDIIDGQHRLFAFDPRYWDGIKDSTTYDMPFSIFITPDLRTRRLLFTITNEKQKAVSANLLLYLKDKLGMLTETESLYLPLVNLLNSENKSPLKDRIILSAEKKPRGYKAKELIKIFDRAKLGELTIQQRKLTKDELLNALSTYLSGWEVFYGVSFRKPKGAQETATKISGLRYMILLFPVFFENTFSSKSPFTTEYVQQVIQDLEDSKQLTEEQTLFDEKADFQSETATVKRANSDSIILKAYLTDKISDSFNPFV